MYKLRYYQENCHNDLLSYLQGKDGEKPTLAVLPTGTGKSLNIATLAKDYGEGKIITICPSKEILEQNYKKYLSFGGEGCIYSASFKSKVMCHNTFATLGSIKNLGKQFKDHGVTMLCIDEAHLNTDASGGMFTQFMSDLSPRHVVGFTATPFRLKNYSDPSGYSYSQLTMMNRSRPKLFSNISHVTQVPDMVEKGFWAPMDLHNIPFDPLGLLLNSTGAEYTEQSIKIAVKNNNVNNKIYKLTKSLISEGSSSILLFLDTVESCYIMANALGSIAAVVEAKTKLKDRDNIINSFKDGSIKVICCVSTLTTGFDFPELETVVMGRPTNSLAVFYQIFGRVVRPYKGKTGSFYDFCGNLDRFGDIRSLSIENYNDYGWGVFNGNTLITGLPMGGPPTTKDMLDDMGRNSFRKSNNRFFEFGKYKGSKPEDVPTQYLGWAVINAKSLLSEVLYNDINEKLKTLLK